VEPLPDGILVRKEPLRPRSIDDNGLDVCSSPVAIIEGALLEERETEQVEIRRRHRDPRRHRLGLSWSRRSILEVEIVEVLDIVGRPAVGEGNA
jgi:hypothetical protein